MKAPFPWFGGKSKCAALVWQALGDVEHYVEPFAGSLAVLLGRPTEPRIETVNDIDHWIVNFWRALVADPDGVAHHANNPVNEADLTARHIWLVQTGADRIACIEGDPDFYDVKVAGWWVWGQCCWIGSGWCSGRGPWGSVDGKLVKNVENGVNRKRVHLGNAGRGVNRQRVSFDSYGQGINSKAHHETEGGQGTATGEANIAAYLRTLAERLRYVRVCCGDWRRVLTPGALAYGDPLGVFLDPPYDTDVRDGSCYNTDSEHGHISVAVRDWAVENGDNPRYRIVLAGYEGEYAMPDAWRVVKRKAGRAYGNSSGPTANSDNRLLERLWLSPNCLADGNGRMAQPELFQTAIYP